MSGISGELCNTPELLEATAKAKKRDYIEKRIEKGEQLDSPWEKSGSKWVRPKSFDEKFEDRIWLLLYDLGFKCLNKDRKCRLEYKTYTKQTDVLGRDDLHAFAIQCRTSEGDGFLSIFLFDELEVERRINDVKAARDPEQHQRESATQIEIQAASRLRWFSQVLEDKALNPFIS